MHDYPTTIESLLNRSAPNVPELRFLLGAKATIGYLGEVRQLGGRTGLNPEMKYGLLKKSVQIGLYPDIDYGIYGFGGDSELCRVIAITPYPLPIGEQIIDVIAGLHNTEPTATPKVRVLMDSVMPIREL